MNDCGDSDNLIVPTKFVNKDGVNPLAEWDGGKEIDQREHS